jgi:hypothetical protein
MLPEHKELRGQETVSVKEGENERLRRAVRG